MVSKPSLWLFLSSPVFIGIILDSQLIPPLQLLLQPFVIKPLTRFSHRLWFRTCSRRYLESWDHCHTVATMIVAPIVFLQVPLRSSSADLPSRGKLTIIGATTCRHIPPKDFAQKLTRSTRRHVPSRVVRLSHAPTCARCSPADVNPRWHHHCHVIYWHHLPSHRWPGRWLDRWLALTLTVDFSSRLTFSQSRFFLSNFLRRFHFCSLFLHIVFLNG